MAAAPPLPPRRVRCARVRDCPSGVKAAAHRCATACGRPGPRSLCSPWRDSKHGAGRRSLPRSSAQRTPLRLSPYREPINQRCCDDPLNPRTVSGYRKH